jgi:hypothetical protein
MGSADFSSKNKSNNSEALLVTEQAGLTISLIGVVLAIVLGLGVRGVIAPEKIKSRVMEASRRLGEGIGVSVDQAYLSLSRGMLPDFSVVLKNVHLDVTRKCWLSPDAEINEIRFPISIRDLLAGRSFFHSVEIDSMVLLLRNDMKDCRGDAARVDGVSTQEVSVTSWASQAPSATAPSFVQSESSPNHSAPDIQFISVNRMRVNYLPLPFTSFELLDLDLHLKSNSPKVCSLSSTLNLGGETLSGDYSSRANIQLNYDESIHPQLEGEVSGSWREGQYDLSLKHDLESKELALTGELRHIPLSQVFPVLKKYKVMISDFNGKQTWLSSQFEAKGKIRNDVAIPLALRNFKLEGDLGEVSVATAEIKQWEPIQFEPLQFVLKDIDLKNLLLFLNRPHPSPALGNLGVFNGTAEFRSNQSLKVSGSQRGFEMIFSNKGQREVQTFTEIKGDLNFDHGQWAGDISKVEIKDGEFKGNATVSADRDLQDLRMSLDVQSLTLAPRVQKLMTDGGSAENLQAKFKTRFLRGEMKQLEGRLRGDHLKVGAIQFQKPQFLFSNHGDEFQIDFNSAGAKLESIKFISPLVEQFRPDWQELKMPFNFKKITSRMKTKSLQNFRWESLELVSEQFQLRSQGGWDDKNELFGSLKVTEKGKNQKWKLSGSRDKPLFVKD